jgi:hypothetical protein
MLVHEKESAKRANAELLQKIEEGLAHSREVIAQINELLAQRHARVRPDGFRITTRHLPLVRGRHL